MEDTESEDRVRSNIWLKRAMYEKIEEIAKRDGRSISDVVREALRDLIVKDRRKNEGSKDASIS